MPDPLMLAIAGAVAGKTTELVLKGGQHAYQALVSLVRRRFETEPLGQAALEAAEADPEANTERLATVLELTADTDPEFGRELREAGRAAIDIGGGSNVNIVSGNVTGDVFQMGNVGTFTMNSRKRED